MLHFLQNLLYYMCVEVIEPQWHRFQSKLSTAANVDDVRDSHTEFLDECLKKGLLTNRRVLQCLHKLFSTSAIFARFSERFSDVINFQSEDGEEEEDPEAKMIPGQMGRNGGLVHVKSKVRPR
jgi:gamma-tubulin complex component 2